MITKKQYIFFKLQTIWNLDARCDAPMQCVFYFHFKAIIDQQIIFLKILLFYL